MRTLCPICLDLFDGFTDTVATPCGHVFHSKCILKWVGSSKYCPECRGPVTRNKILRLFFNTVNNNESFNATSLENDLETMKTELKAKDTEMSTLKKKIKDLQLHASSIEERMNSMHQRNLSTQSELDFAKVQLKNLEKLEAKIKNLNQRNHSLCNELEHLNNIQIIAQGSQQEVEDILREQGAELALEIGSDIAKNIASFCSILKRELRKVITEKDQLKKQVVDITYKLGLKTALLQKSLKSYRDLEEKLKKQADVNLSLLVQNKCLFLNSGDSRSSFDSPQPSSSKDREIVLETPTLINFSEERTAGIKPHPLTKDKELVDLTPISVNFSERKRQNLDVVVLDNKVRHPSSTLAKLDIPPLSKVIPPSRGRQEKDEDSVSRIGYNGLGGHGRAIFAKSRAMIREKPYKKNPNVKKSK